MADFTLDTSGEIVLPYPHLHPWPRGYLWSDLSPFEQGYIGRAFAELVEAYRTQVGFKVGDKVRVHADEIGTVSRIIPGTTKCIQVSFGGGFGGQFFPFECTPVAPAFSDLAPATLEGMLRDCAEAFQNSKGKEGPNTLENGAAFWRMRQNHQSFIAERWGNRFPPLRLSLSDDEKIVSEVAK